MLRTLVNIALVCLALWTIHGFATMAVNYIVGVGKGVKTLTDPAHRCAQLEGIC